MSDLFFKNNMRNINTTESSINVSNILNSINKSNKYNNSVYNGQFGGNSYSATSSIYNGQIGGNPKIESSDINNLLSMLTTSENETEITAVLEEKLTSLLQQNGGASHVDMNTEMMEHKMRSIIQQTSQHGGSSRTSMVKTVAAIGALGALGAYLNKDADVTESEFNASKVLDNIAPQASDNVFMRSTRPIDNNVTSSVMPSKLIGEELSTTSEEGNRVMQTTTELGPQQMGGAINEDILFYNQLGGANLGFETFLKMTKIVGDMFKEKKIDIKRKEVMKVVKRLQDDVKAKDNTLVGGDLLKAATEHLSKNVDKYIKK
jgi:hypothetical protein